MLHRLTLRVLPSLALTVTESQVRKRKRLVMLVPGLVAFAVYRAVKQIDSLSEPLALLAVSGLLSAVTGLCAYRIGRATTLKLIWKEDGFQKLAWLVGWVGFTYGVQLSLLVLALLRVLVHYDFLRHPDGPAMMAIIIACTSVARDAFEIGHVRRQQQQGQSFLTFPNGTALRMLLLEQPGPLAQWSLTVGGICSLFIAGVSQFGEIGRDELGQFLAVSVIAGSTTLLAYLAGKKRSGGWLSEVRQVGWLKLFQFWWWPGLAFAATYYLVLLGAVIFIFRMETGNVLVQMLMAGMVAGMMAIYGYYLGDRRYREDRVQQMVPPSLLRCPFVMGILSKSGTGLSEGDVRPDALIGKVGRRG